MTESRTQIEKEEFKREKIRTRLWQLANDLEGADGVIRERLIHEAADAVVRIEPPQWLKEKDVAERYPFSLGWLRNARWEGIGPAFHRIGGRDAIGSRIHYHSADIEAFLAECRVNPEDMDT